MCTRTSRERTTLHPRSRGGHGGPPHPMSSLILALDLELGATVLLATRLRAVGRDRLGLAEANRFQDVGVDLLFVDEPLPHAVGAVLREAHVVVVIADVVG